MRRSRSAATTKRSLAANPSIRLPQVIFVTGKGGTGKTTLSAAWALALARERPVTLIDLDGRDSAPDEVEDTLAHPNLKRVRMSRQSELEAFIERIVPVKMVARRMLRSRTFGFVTAALPGLEAFLMLDRIRLIAEEVGPDGRLVIDAPATGTALELLAVAAGLKRLAPIGTLHRLASAIDDFQRNGDRFAVMITLRAEELALREALAAVATVSEAGIRCAGVLLNGVTSSLFSEAEVARLAQHAELHRLAEMRQAAVSACGAARRQLHSARLAVVETPMLFRAKIERAELETLADILSGCSKP